MSETGCLHFLEKPGFSDGVKFQIIAGLAVQLMYGGALRVY
jgi:hypothetical protein